MFAVLSELKYRINKDISQIEETWDENPSNDYYFAEICGLRRALDHVIKAEAKELTALDMWADQQQKEKEENAITIRDGSGS